MIRPTLDDYLFDPMWRWRKWIWGIPADIWIKHIDIIESIIKKGQAKLINEVFLPPINEIAGAVNPAVATREAAPKATAAKQILKIPFPGGIRFAHFHYKGDVYRVSPEGWQQFSKGVVEGMMQKLGSAKSVSFEQVMELSGSIDTLG